VPSLVFDYDDLVERGPRIPVLLSWPEEMVQAELADGYTPPRTLTVEALVDTGSSITAISPDVADHFALNPLGMTALVGVHGTRDRPIYQLRLIPSMGRNGSPAPVFDPWWVVGMEADLGYRCILGRDILAHATPTYMGRENRVRLDL